MTCATRASPEGRPSSGSNGGGGRASMRTATALTQGRAPTLARAAFSKSSLMGQAGVVSSMRKDTAPVAASMARSLMNPQSTMFIPKSGSMMVDRAASTSPSRDCTAAGAGGEEGAPPPAEERHRARPRCGAAAAAAGRAGGGARGAARWLGRRAGSG
jgi:hypothetical protein